MIFPAVPVLWLMPLPLAIPTYIGAYVYVEMFEPLGVAHTAAVAVAAAATTR